MLLSPAKTIAKLPPPFGLSLSKAFPVFPAADAAAWIGR